MTPWGWLQLKPEDVKGFLGCMGLTLCLFILDLTIPRGVAAGILYIIVVMASLSLSNIRVTTFFAVMVSLLTLIGLFSGYSPSVSAFWVVTANRLLTLLAIWALVFVMSKIFRTKRSLKKAVTEASDTIIQLQETQQELSALQAKNTLILNAAGEGIYGLDLEGNTTFVNPCAEALLGYKAGELIGQHQHTTVHHTKPDGNPHPVEECPIYATVQRGETHHVDHDVFWRKDGAPFDVEYTSTPIYEAGKLVGSVVTFNDITQRRSLEAQLLQAQKMESIGHLAAGIAHEINNPAAYVINNIYLINKQVQKMKALPQEQQVLIPYWEKLTRWLQTPMTG